MRGMRGIAVLLLAASFVSAQTKSATKTVAPKAAPKTTPKAAPKSVAPKPPPARTLAPPKDETARDKALGPFLAQIKDILRRKDRTALLALLAEDLDLGISGMRGPSAFFTAWGLGEPDSAVYGVFTQVLSLAGTWTGDQYCAPYAVVQFPAGLDRSKHQVILNPNVRLRATASTSARVVATTSYEIVELLERGADWTKVRTGAGIEGFLQTAYLYSPAGYHACFAKNSEGVWKVQAFKPGH